ncbi:glycosyltransferase [Streptomyces radicis]|uniref:D-inositol 3-phosphate glycosyltransferase n=1 Tax=Streptomyces radicis TaxID=1750517 RepID=A0A3A9W1Z6_9ACTN|nr:glycosyltransferase [Streptomyces radicis]RKN07255.1 glycosyltransferase [Streptomyces radicis]RKN26728.1 glycosyltransferase [Streptomyces radicis]
MRRALHIITGLGVGGAERQLRALLRRLPLPCDVVTLTEPGQVATELAADGVRVAHLGMLGNRDMSALPRLARLIRRGRYDVVHTHLYRACVYGRVAARMAGVRAVVATEHSLGARRIEGRPLTPSTRALYLATERVGSATVAVSHTVARRLADWGVPPRRIHLVPNGIEPAHFRFDPGARAVARARLGLPDNALAVGGVGRLVAGKRFGALVRAVAALPDDVWLVLAGEGPERAALRALAARLGVGRRVVLAGAWPDVRGLLAALDVLVSPSREETFGLAVLEGLAAGLPVLHAACPAVDELPEGAAPGARRVASDPDAIAAALREERAWGARRLPVPEALERYGMERVAERLMDVYRGVCAR